MNDFKIRAIPEFWDYRLSLAVPVINNKGKTWIVEIKAKPISYNPAIPGSLAQTVEVYDTGIACEENDSGNPDKIKTCYEWMRSVRDKYSLPNIEKLKPLAAEADKANAALAAELSANLK